LKAMKTHGTHGGRCEGAYLVKVLNGGERRTSKKECSNKMVTTQGSVQERKLNNGGSR